MYCITLNNVPFHPDEATYLYMSDDIEKVIDAPSSLFYRQGQSIDLKTHYRLMDPPMVTWVIGAGRLLTGISPIENDWDWTISWQQNLQAGNMPTQQAILIGRLSILLLFPFTCLFLYRITKKLIHHWGGILAVLIFALNPLIVLHTRHSMPDGILIFLIMSVYILMFDDKKHNVLIPITIALAINSKQTAIFMVPAYLIYFLWRNKGNKIFAWLKSAASYIIVPLLLTFLLNPVSWAEPIPTITAAINERAILMQGIDSFMQDNNPEKYNRTLPERFLSVTYHTFYESLALDDITNYRDDQQGSFDEYQNSIFHNHSRNLFMGTVNIIFVLTAILIQFLHWFKKRKSSQSNLILWLMIYSTFMVSIFGLSFLSSIYQRYVIILLPFTSIFTSWLLTTVFSSIKKQPAKPVV